MPMAKKSLNYLISFRYNTYWAIEFLSKREKSPNNWRVLARHRRAIQSK
jgi:hypothetical protein